MTHGSLFSGIGGFDLAAEWMGWENLFHCEWNEFGQKILKYYWPNAVSYKDIKNADFTIWRGKIDVLSGGFPCQPYSSAGKRKGTADDRHLWPEMLRCIQECQPRWVLGENVDGIFTWNDGLVFEAVCADLENEGYEVQPLRIPACATQAPHRRDRWWFIAHAERTRTRNQNRAAGHQGRRASEDWEEGIRQKNWEAGTGRAQPTTTNAADPTGAECERARNTRHGRDGFTNHFTNAADANGARIETDGHCTIRNRKTRTDISGHWSETWLEAATRLCRLDDGLSGRLDGITLSSWRRESLKGFGNAIVPQVAFEIFQAIQKVENEKK